MIERYQLPVTEVTRAAGMSDDLLISRVNGRGFLACFREIVRGVPASTVTDLDFSAVTLMDASFADEVFGQLASERGHDGVGIGPIVLVSINADSCSNLEYALSSRPSREAGLRNCVVPIGNDGQLQLVGKYEEHVRQSFHLLLRRKELTARDVAAELDLSIAAASTRLKTLFDLGLALRVETRDEQGRQYTYYGIG